MDKIIFEFDVLWQGWEMDNTAWVMQREDGSRYLKMTSHGSDYEASVGELLSRVDEYQTALFNTKKAIDLLGNQQ